MTSSKHIVRTSARGGRSRDFGNRHIVTIADAAGLASHPAAAALVVFALALALRLLHLWQISSSPFMDTLLGDAKAYDDWAQRLAAGDWLGREVFYQAPLYPYLLGAFYSLAGRDLVLVRVAQAVLSAGACVLLASAARRLFSPSAGVIAGLALALSASAIFADGLLQKSALDLFLVCLSLWVISFLAMEPSRRGLWLALGVVMGALSLTRENSLLLLVPLLAWIEFDRRVAYPVRLSSVVCLLTGAVLLLAPVAVRNAVVGHGFYPTTAQFGPNLYIGNHSGASGLYEPLRPGRGTPEFERRDAIELAEAAVGRSLTPADVSRYWTRRSLEFVTDHPADWARVTARKLLLLVNAAEIADSESQESHAEWSAVLAVLGPLTHFGILVPLACLGAWSARRQWRQLWILPTLVITYALSVVAFFILARYRYPLIPFLILFGAAGLAQWPGARTRAAWRQRAITVGILIIAVVTTNLPIIAANSTRALTENNLGTALQVAGRLDEALIHYRRAIAIDDSYVDAYLNAGTVLAATGRREQALTAFNTAVTLAPQSGRAHYFLGKTLLEDGKATDGIARLQVASRLTPDAEEVHTELGAALADDEQLDLAIAEFREAVRLAPQLARAHWNLGSALAAHGAPLEAVPHLRRAAALNDADGQLRADLASALLDAREFEEAVREFQASLARTQPTADTLNRLGVALASSGKLPDAIEAFRASLAIQADFEDARRNLTAARGRTR